MAERTARWNGWDRAGAAGHAPGEWPALYAQYLLRAAGQSTRSSDLYQKIMDCVAQGELPPTVFKDMASGFIQARGPAYTARLADLNARFFAGMVQLDSAASQEWVNLLSPETDPAPPTPPPAFEATDPVEWYQELTEYAGQLSADALSAYQRMLERVAAGEIAPSQVQETSAG